MSNQQTPSTQQQVDYAKWIEELKRRDAERAHNRHDDFFDAVNRATIENGQLAIRTFVLVNGGAAISVLAFIGSLVSEERITLVQLSNVASSLVWFALGVAAALISLGFSYFTNYATVELTGSKQKKWDHPWVVDGTSSSKWNATINICKVIAILAGIASVILFLVGMFDVRAAILALR